MFEDLVIAIFNQQWPRLRRSFRFCTGVLSRRDAMFDLAISPPDAIRQIGESENSVVLNADRVDAAPKLLDEDWIQIAIQDLMSPKASAPLRQFLWKFGPDFQDGRAAYRALCEIFLAISRTSDSVEQALSATAHFFREPTTCLRLKRELFGSGGYYAAMPNGEPTVLRALVTHPAADSLPEEVAHIEHRAASLALADITGAAEIAASAAIVGGERAGSFLDGFATGISSSPIFLSSIPLSLTIDLLKRRPELATRPELWRRPAREQMDISVQIALRGASSLFAQQVIRAVLVEKAWPALPNLLAHFGSTAVGSVLEWIDESNSSSALPQSVLGAMQEYRSELLEAVGKARLGARSLRLVATMLDPRSDDVRSIPRSTWVHLVGSDMQLPSNSELRCRTFLLSLGLSARDDNDALLVREGFSAVYDAARQNQLDDYLWDYVEPYLPWYLANWDRCARLVRGVVGIFLEHDWPVSEFVATFSTEEQFGRALDEADRRFYGWRYIKRIRNLSNINSPVLTPSQLALLDRFRG